VWAFVAEIAVERGRKGSQGIEPFYASLLHRTQHVEPAAEDPGIYAGLQECDNVFEWRA